MKKIKVAWDVLRSPEYKIESDQASSGSNVLAANICNIIYYPMLESATGSPVEHILTIWDS